MKHLPSTLTLICVALTVIAFPATVPAAETSILDSSKKIELPGGVSLDMVKVESGTFEMSAKDGENLKYEVPHQVTLTRDFYIGRTEVTQAQWKAVMGTNPSYFKGDNLPVESVSWNDVMSFCEKLNSKGNAPSGWMFTLPTETQWEYAARGGKESKGYKYSGSDIIDAVAWYWENSGDRRLDDDSSWDFLLRESNHCKTHPVGQKKANELGLYDMSGNVYEWCLDDWNDDSSKLTAEFTRGNDQSGTDRALRSGSWDEISRKGRSMYRYRFPPNSRLINFGFRLALVQISNNKSGESQITARDSGSGSTTENVSADAQFKQGLEYYEKNDYSEAIKLFKNAAEQGNVSAQYKLGICYKNGFGDYAEAMKWFRKAADQGNAEAQYELGYCYENRLGNPNEAVVWYQKASDNGNEDAKKKIEQLAEENVERNISLENRKKIELSGGVSLEMVKVEAGTFEMSVMNGIKSGFGEVAHPATLTQDFFIGKTEVTQAQWKEVMGENPVAYLSLSYSVIGDNLPVVEVSWSKAMEFCEKLNATGKAPNGWKFTLPTETQWEYAARGGNKSKGYKYSGSNNIDEVAWYYGNSGDRKLDDSSFSLTLMESNNCRPHPVGQKKANELGLYDMSGNVYEWCLDDWQDKSDTLKAEFSRENDRGKSSRTIRGGAFLYLSELSHPARRNIGHNGDRSNFTGFRLALVQTSSEKGEEKNTPAIQDKIPEQTAQKIDLPGGVSIEMVKVEAGTFIMGAKDGYNYPNEVQRRVTLKLDYLIGKTEITQAQWKAVMGNNPSRFQGDDLPVENITWDDAMAFCEKLNTMSKAPSGWTFTLPTETQWEYAARGGNKSRGYIYSGSNNAGEVAWYSDPLFKTHPIGQKKANELGLYDMSGNVSEWCLDNDDVPDGFRSVRGGSSSERKTMDIRVARRLALAHDWHLESNGFRLALVPTQK